MIKSKRLNLFLRSIFILVVVGQFLRLLEKLFRPMILRLQKFHKLLRKIIQVLKFNNYFSTVFKKTANSGVFAFGLNGKQKYTKELDITFLNFSRMLEDSKMASKCYFRVFWDYLTPLHISKNQFIYF